MLGKLDPCLLEGPTKTQDGADRVGLFVGIYPLLALCFIGATAD